MFVLVWKHGTSAESGDVEDERSEEETYLLRK